MAFLHHNSSDGVFYVDKWVCGYKGAKPTGILTLKGDTRGIANEAFSYCSGLTSVTIPNSVTSIGSYAFRGCSGLQSVVVGNGITSLPDYVFSTGNSLKSLTIGTGVLSISQNAFHNGSQAYKPIKSIWLTNTPPTNYTYAEGTVNYVANNLYTDLKNKTEYKFLSSLFDVDGVKYVPVSPSERTCDAIDCLYDEGAENIHIGKTVTNKGVTLTVEQVHPYAFYKNNYIKDVNLSFGGNVGNAAFYGCTNVKNVDIDNAGSIGASVFSESSKLTTLQIGSQVTNIGNNAFQNCTGLITATVNNKGSLGNYVFQGDQALVTVTLGEGITSLGAYVFDGCSSLRGIVIPNTVERAQRALRPILSLDAHR